MLAFYLGKAGRLEEAIGLFRALLSDSARVLGVDHPDTLDVRHMLAHLSYQSGNKTEALDLLRVLLAHQSRVLGPDHPRTVWTRTRLREWEGEGESGAAIKP